MTLNCRKFKFSRNFALVGMFGRQHEDEDRPALSARELLRRNGDHVRLKLSSRSTTRYFGAFVTKRVATPIDTTSIDLHFAADKSIFVEISMVGSVRRF